MKTTISAVVLPILLAGCVTSGDLQRVAETVGRLEATVATDTATPEEVQAAITATKDEIRAVAEEVEDRTEGFVEALTSPEGGGTALLVSGLVGMGLNMYRNAQRKKRGEPVAVPPKA